MVHDNGQKVADIPAVSLVLGGDAPVYVRQQKKPPYIDEHAGFDLSSVPVPDDMNQVFATVDVGSHFRVPAAGSMSEMDACLNQLLVVERR